MNLDGLDVSVEESWAELRYSFTQTNPGPRPRFPFGSLLFWFGMPLAVAVFVGYVLLRAGADRPWWEVLLAGTLAVQMVATAITGWLGPVGLNLRRWTDHARPTVLSFTQDGCTHGGYGGTHSVCDLAAVRGVRLFRFESGSPEPGADVPHSCAEQPSPIQYAGLSLVVGDDGLTHGLFGWFEPAPLAEFAEDITRRLSAFRMNKGLPPTDPIDVVDTTPAGADEGCHTRPLVPVFGRSRLVAQAVLTNRVACALWSAVGLAGLVCTWRVVRAANLSTVPVAALLVVLGLLHAMLFWMALRGQLVRDPEVPASKDSETCTNGVQSPWRLS